MSPVIPLKASDLQHNNNTREDQFTLTLTPHRTDHLSYLFTYRSPEVISFGALDSGQSHELGGPT